jgi:hypothetical protein
MDIQANLCPNAIRKVALLITKAAELGMDLSCYGHAGENGHNGNVYLWLEDYHFTLYIPLGGDDEIQAVWTNMYDGEEETRTAEGTTLRELEAWTHYMNVKADEMEAA